MKPISISYSYSPLFQMKPISISHSYFPPRPQPQLQVQPQVQPQLQLQPQPQPQNFLNFKQQMIQQLKQDPKITKQQRLQQLRRQKQMQTIIISKYQQILCISDNSIYDFMYELMVDKLSRQLIQLKQHIQLRQQLVEQVSKFINHIQYEQNNDKQLYNPEQQQLIINSLEQLECQIYTTLKMCNQLIDSCTDKNIKRQYRQNQDILLTVKNNETQQIKQHTKQILRQYEQSTSNITNKLITNQQFFQQLQFIKRKNNNQIQQYRGNIRVFCRIRPSLSENIPKIHYTITDSSLTITKACIDIMGKQKFIDQTFMFDKIFDVMTKQDMIFTNMMDLVRNTLDGDDLCIFAYGQTGSGKTYTMNGKYDHIENLGLIPRTLNYLFIQLEKIKLLLKSTKVSVSISEIYNQVKRDLLDTTTNNNNMKNNNQNQNNNSKYNNNNKNAKKYQCDLKQIIIQSLQQGNHILTKANLRRSTASTQCNQHSSRSHLIFSIKIQLIYKKNQQKLFTSNLVLVDLAGSQRIKQSKAQGDRKQQAKYINLSLTTLGKVMRQIQAGGTPIYRDSELTRTLQPYLEGTGKAVMFVNISPDLDNEEVSLQSLRFAEGVRECKVKEKNNKDKNTNNNSKK